MGLTQKRVEKLNTPGRYSDGHQLYLQVQSTTNKSLLDGLAQSESFRSLKRGSSGPIGSGRPKSGQCMLVALNCCAS
ncbi:MAG: hypothetical protein WBE82_09920, partial [Xanthobacteraceae bacterium]